MNDKLTKCINFIKKIKKYRKKYSKMFLSQFQFPQNRLRQSEYKRIKITYQSTNINHSYQTPNINISSQIYNTIKYIQYR